MTHSCELLRASRQPANTQVCASKIADQIALSMVFFRNLRVLCVLRG